MNLFLDEKSNILFSKNKKGYYEPIAVKYNKETGSCQLIQSDPVLFELYEFVNRHQRKRKSSGKYVSDPVFPYQWSFILRHAIALLDETGEQKLEAYARQSGKSFGIKLLMAWEQVFLPRYINVRLERYTTILCSYKKESVEKLFIECKKSIKIAVDFHNERYNDKLVIKNGEYNNNKLLDNTVNFEINKRFSDGDEVPYSKSVALTMGTTNDGLSAFHIIVDEAGLCDYDLFNTSVQPFTASVNGCTTFIGVPNQDSSSLLYRKYNDITVTNTIYDADSVIKMRLMVDKDFAEKYSKNLEREILSHGMKSSFIQWNFFLNFTSLNGKFVTKQILEDNNLLVNDISIPRGDTNTFKIGAIDVSASGDFKPMVIGETTVITEIDRRGSRQKGYVSKVCDMVTFNKKGKKQSGEDFAKLCVEKCAEFRLDMVIMDSTSAGGKIFTQLFRKYVEINKIKMTILPFSYNQNKQLLFGYLEDAIFSNKISLLKEKASWESQQLVDEMCYMIKEQGSKGSTYIKYYAPQGSGFYDDHVNALALFNSCLREVDERARDKRRCVANDGSGKRWLIKRRRFEVVDDENINWHKAHSHDDTKVFSIWDVPI